MANIVVTVPGHGEFEFPEGMSDADMQAALNKYLDDPQGGASTQSAMEAAASRLGKAGIKGDRGAGQNIGQNYGFLENAVQGMPVLGAYQPTSPVGAAYQAEHPYRATAAKIGGAAVGSAPFFAMGPAGVLGRAAASAPAWTAIGTAAGLGGADTLARGGTLGEAARDAVISGATSGALGAAGKVAAGAARPFLKKLYEKRASLTGDWHEAPDQQVAARAFRAGNRDYRPKMVPNENFHEGTQGIGTGIGAGIGYMLGAPEAGAFVGYGVSPLINAYVPPISKGIYDNAARVAAGPTLQSIVHALQQQGTRSDTFKDIWE